MNESTLLKKIWSTYLVAWIFHLMSFVLDHTYINSFHFQVQPTFITFVLYLQCRAIFHLFCFWYFFQMTNGEQETLNAFGHVFWPIICLEVGLLTWDYGKTRTWTRRYNDVNKGNRNWVSNMYTANDIIYPIIY